LNIRKSYVSIYIRDMLYNFPCSLLDVTSDVQLKGHRPEGGASNYEQL